jgi:hypothetical protein
VGFGESNDNTIKGLTSLLSVKEKIDFIAYTCKLWNEKCIWVQQEGKFDDIHIMFKSRPKMCFVVLEDHKTI